MIEQQSLLVTLVELVDRLPIPPPSNKRGPGRPRVYTDRLFLKALVIMILRHLHTVTELLSVLAQPTTEMQQLRVLLTERGKFPREIPFAANVREAPEGPARHLARPNRVSGEALGRPDKAVGE